MKKVMKLSMIAMVASLVVGCATNGDIENLQSQIDGLKTSVAQASSDAQSAQSAAADAAAKASAAESAANRAAQYAQDTNSKLDNMFKKSMMK
ncbi:MAG: Lpp/OprI family alanine-zipper lipoprotein [Methylococcales bacterium]|nr:Lpp/OprI family alanine-zipper lipoprotein [Methylococcales bacterium]MDD5632088.1 Lpp/OprI family alanine-zipper lipoprotein [Methylococcales bacterium]